MNLFITFFAVTVTALAGCAAAQTTNGPDELLENKKAGVGAELQSYTWYDGWQERKVWVDPGLVAEFDPPSAQRSPVKLVFPDAKPVANDAASVRIWKLAHATSPSAAMSNIKSASAAGKVSPVFHDVNSAGAPSRALPGNVIVQLHPGWDQARVQQWIEGRNLKIVQKAIWGENVYVIKTKPGLDALKTANRLYESGEVVSASPDWWIEAQPR